MSGTGKGVEIAPIQGIVTIHRVPVRVVLKERTKAYAEEPVGGRDIGPSRAPVVPLPG